MRSCQSPSNVAIVRNLPKTFFGVADMYGKEQNKKSYIKKGEEGSTFAIFSLTR
jgi:hypothetical protein